MPKELLSENPIPDIVAESQRVIEILKRNPDDPEVDNLLDAPVFQGMVVDSYFQSMKKAADSNERQNYKERHWLEKVISAHGYSKRQSRNIVAHSLDNYTTDTGDGSELWQRQYAAFSRKLETLQDLSSEDPAAALTLTTRWGIMAFERYSAVELLNQLHYPDTREELCITPRSDHNGAFAFMGMKLSGYADRPFFVEAGSATELARIGLRLSKDERSFKKIVIAAHSDGRDLTLDKYNVGLPLGVWQLSQERARRWISALSVVGDQAEISLMACSTGMQGGVQDEIFKIPKVAKVTAPTEAAGSRGYGMDVIRHTAEDGRDVGRVLQKG